MISYSKMSCSFLLLSKQYSERNEVKVNAQSLFKFQVFDNIFILPSAFKFILVAIYVNKNWLINKYILPSLLAITDKLLNLIKANIISVMSISLDFDNKSKQSKAKQITTDKLLI